MIYIKEKQPRKVIQVRSQHIRKECVISFVDFLFGWMTTIKFLCWTGKRALQQLKCNHTVSHHCHHHYHHSCVMYQGCCICLALILIIKSPNTLLDPVFKSFLSFFIVTPCILSSYSVITPTNALK